MARPKTCIIIHMGIKKHLPNAITSLNLFAGCVALVFALRGQLDVAAYCVLASGVFDLLDGLVARALRVSSPLGKELDSLADVVSFGAVPGAVFYQLLQIAAPANAWLPYLGFVVTVFSAIRLAKFNIDTRQTVDFIGLNTPTNAFFVVSLPFVATQYPAVVHSIYFLIACIALTSYLLISEMRLFSLKFDSLSWQKNREKFILIIIGIVLIGLFKFAAIPIILVLYFVFSFIYFKRAT